MADPTFPHLVFGETNPQQDNTSMYRDERSPLSYIHGQQPKREPDHVLGEPVRWEDTTPGQPIA